MIRYLIGIVWCHFTHGHLYGAWEHHDTARGHRVYLRACTRCGWMTTQRDWTPGGER